jgi:hypothetical protein
MRHIIGSMLLISLQEIHHPTITPRFPMRFQRLTSLHLSQSFQLILQGPTNMFRVFLKQKIETKVTSETIPREVHSSPSLRERRRYERHDMDYKHLSVLNDADILSVRDISLQGFSTEVGSRCFERLKKNDVYETRIRYLGEVYAMHARVAWKAGSLVGFQLVEAPSETQLFLRRLIASARIGNQLVKSQLDSRSMADAETKKDLFRGPENSELHVWRHASSGQVMAWQLSAPPKFIEWSDSIGIVTGRVSSTMLASGEDQGHMTGSILHPDAQSDQEKVQFALDVLMALRDPSRDELVKTLMNSAQEV